MVWAQIIKHPEGKFLAYNKSQQNKLEIKYLPLKAENLDEIQKKISSV